MDIDRLHELLKLEYERSQESIDKFDEYRARLKGWMITVVTGVTAVALSQRHWQLLVIGTLAVTMFALAELSYMDIQEEAIDRARELEGLISDLLHAGPTEQHNAYTFGIGKVFRGGRLRVRNFRRWIMYRTFNPYLYVGALLMPLLGLFVGLAADWFTLPQANK